MNINQIKDDSKLYKPIFNNRIDHLKFCANAVSVEGSICEFGVWKGETLKVLSNLFPEKTIYGFDSFAGLPETWYRSFDRNRRSEAYEFALPHVPLFDENVSLEVGWFESTIPNWMNGTDDSLSLIHIDSDLYSSAKTILNSLNNKIVSGTVIVFDELCDWQDQGVYERWQEGEAKAFVEWVKSYNRSVEPLSRTEWIEGSFIVKG